MTATMNTTALSHGMPPPLPSPAPKLHNAMLKGPTHQTSKRPRSLPLLELAGGCFLASALGAALVIGANDAVRLSAPEPIPAPRFAKRLHTPFPPGTSPKRTRVNSPAQQQSLYLVRSTLLALDQANRTGNYSVLRALGTPNFQERNSSADLAVIFSSLRRNNIDMAEVALLLPKWQHPTRNGKDGLKLRGLIPMTNREVYFDMQFKSISGNWHIYAISVSTQTRKPGPGNAGARNDTAKRNTKTSGQPRNADAAPTG